MINANKQDLIITERLIPFGVVAEHDVVVTAHKLQKHKIAASQSIREKHEGPTFESKTSDMDVTGRQR